MIINLVLKRISSCKFLLLLLLETRARVAGLFDLNRHLFANCGPRSENSENSVLYFRMHTSTYMYYALIIPRTYLLTCSRVINTRLNYTKTCIGG